MQKTFTWIFISRVDSIACAKPCVFYPVATMTWELFTSADLEEKLAVAAATNFGDIRAVT